MLYFDPTTPSTSVATDNTNSLNITLDGAEPLNDTLANAQQMPQSCVDDTSHTDEDSFELGTPSTINNTTINIIADEAVDAFADAPLTPSFTSYNNIVPLGLFSYSTPAATPAATPAKDQTKYSPPFVATSGVEQLAHILAYNTYSKKEWSFAPKSIPNKFKNFFATKDEVNFDLDNDYTRYSLDNFGQLIPADFNQQTFVAIFAVVKELGAEHNKILFARANGSQDKKLSHAQLASGAEQACACLAAGEIHFKKEQGTWIVSQINNQTGHFLGDLYSLFVPLQLLLPRTELWGENVSIRQVVNSASTLVGEGPQAFGKTPYEHNVNYLRVKFAQVAIEQAALLVQDSSPPQLTFLLDNGLNLLRIVNEKMAQESTQSPNQHFEHNLSQNKAGHAIQMPVKTDFQPLIKPPLRPMVASRIADRASLNRGVLNHTMNFNLCDSDENDQQPIPLSFSAFKSNLNSSDSRQSNRSFRLANEVNVKRDLANNPNSRDRDRNYGRGESDTSQVPLPSNVLQNRSGLLPLPLPQLQSMERDSDYIRDENYSRVLLPNNVLQNRSSLFPYPLPRLQPLERDSDYLSDGNYSRVPLPNTVPQNRSGLFYLPPTQLQQHDESIQDEHSTPTHK